MMKNTFWINDDDKFYLQWISDYPDGFVVNTPRKISPEYFLLHRAICKSIREGRNYVQGAFTERQYTKVVGRTEGDILAFASHHGIARFSRRCSHCKP